MPRPRHGLHFRPFRTATARRSRRADRSSLPEARLAEPLKQFFCAALVDRLGDEIAAVYPTFARASFVEAAATGLEDLELLDRARHIATCLADHLPPAYPAAIDVLLRSLGARHAGDELIGAGMASFFYLPHVIFVAEHGLDDFELSMRAQYELTRRFTAEFSIRFFIEREPERTLAVLRDWTADADPHVRRLASEGTRLRLPWARRVAWLDRNPEAILTLLERLRDDPAPLVRRSVANNLNDLGRVHPELLVRTCAAWLAGAGPERRALVEHALRGAVKRADPAALALLGYGDAVTVSVEDVRFEPPRVAIGGTVAIGFTLRSTARRMQELLIDLRVHFVKAGGRVGPKVFKVRRVTLAAGERVRLSKPVSLAVHTTRTPRPGRHDVELLVNGSALPLGAFDVVAGGGAGPAAHATS